jgi:Domain of unknown function (DUF4338)/Transposase DNA-binding/Transposase Tn5 dimerisation domain
MFHYPVHMVVCGQSFPPALLERIAASVAQEPQLSRRALSRRVCEWIDWRSANGRLKQMSCRVALLKLTRSGALSLPPAKPMPIGSARAPTGRDPPRIEALSVPLAQLGTIELLRVGSRHSRAARLWTALMAAHHYLGAGPLCGAQLRYLIRSSRHGIVGALAFSAAAWRVAARDRFIGWSEPARQANLGAVVANSRFLILPQVRVPHLASHVLGLCVKRVPVDWAGRYGQSPLLMESFVERARFRGTCYRAANWQHVGASAGRGRQDHARRHGLPVKDIYLYPLQHDWRERLCALPPGVPPQPIKAGGASADWAQQELSRARLGDARLQARLVTLARDFYARPRAQIPQACGSRAKAKAAYRFFDHRDTTMDAILQSHYEASAARVSTHPVVLAVQDTTSLNYNAQPAIENLGPIGSQRDGALGLMVHDTMAFTPTGLPLGLLDVQCWARDAKQFGKHATRHARPIEDKESYKWLKSVAAVARVQEQCPQTTLVSVGDREADIFELFDFARQLKGAPKLLIRAEQNRKLTADHATLWAHLGAQPIAGVQQLQVPRRGSRAARIAKMAISHACVELKAPTRQGKLKPITVWAVWAREIDAPHKTTPLEWMLLSTCEVQNFEQACEKLTWYAARWGIEVYHRTLKSGCQIETRQLGSADRIEACLAIDLVVAWRILHLTKLGRDHPDVPCTLYFTEAEWKALLTFVNRDLNVPHAPPSLREATRLVAGLGGFLGRKCDGEPGTQTLWLGLQRLDDITAMYQVFTHEFARPPPTVSSRHTYG